MVLYGASTVAYSWWTKSCIYIWDLIISSKLPYSANTDVINVIWGRPRFVVLSSLNNSLFVMLLLLLFKMLITYFNCWLLMKVSRSMVLVIRRISAFVYLKLHPSSCRSNPPLTSLLKYPMLHSVWLVGFGYSSKFDMHKLAYFSPASWSSVFLSWDIFYGWSGSLNLNKTYS